MRQCNMLAAACRRGAFGARCRSWVGGSRSMQPDMFASAVHALHLLLEPTRLLLLFLGVLIGLAIGVLPGLSGIVGLAMLIPFTYNLDEYTAFALLLGMAAVITSPGFLTAVLLGGPR